MPSTASVAPHSEERAHAGKNQEGEDDQHDEQSLLHVTDNRTRRSSGRYGFPYPCVRPTGESSTFPSARSIRSTRTSIASPSRYVRRPRRPASAVASSFGSK